MPHFSLLLREAENQTSLLWSGCWMPQFWPVLPEVGILISPMLLRVLCVERVPRGSIEMIPQSRPRKLQSSPPKRNLRSRQYCHLARRQNLPHPRNRFLKPLQRCCFIGSMNQSCRDISPIRAVDLDYRVVALVKFKQSPLRCGSIQIRYSFPHQRRTPARHKQNQPFDETGTGMPLVSPLLRDQGTPEADILPQVIHPQNPERQSRINRTLRLLPIHSQHRESRLSASYPSSRINRPKRFLQIHTARQSPHHKLRKMPLQRPPQLRFVRCPARLLRRRRPSVALPANLQLCRTRLPQSLHRQPQRCAFHLRIEHAPYGISLARPQMQQALVVLA